MKAIPPQIVWMLGWMFQNWELFMGCLCGCKTPLLHAQDLSKLGSIPLTEMFVCVCVCVCVCEFLDLMI
jgi:hypothetical protein